MPKIDWFFIGVLVGGIAASFVMAGVEDRVWRSNAVAAGHAEFVITDPSVGSVEWRWKDDMAVKKSTSTRVR